MRTFVDLPFCEGTFFLRFCFCCWRWQQSDDDVLPHALLFALRSTIVARRKCSNCYWKWHLCRRKACIQSAAGHLVIHLATTTVLASAGSARSCVFIVFWHLSRCWQRRKHSGQTVNRPKFACCRSNDFVCIAFIASFHHTAIHLSLIWFAHLLARCLSQVSYKYCASLSGTLSAQFHLHLQICTSPLAPRSYPAVSRIATVAYSGFHCSSPLFVDIPTCVPLLSHGVVVPLLTWDLDYRFVCRRLLYQHLDGQLDKLAAVLCYAMLCCAVWRSAHALLLHAV